MTLQIGGDWVVKFNAHAPTGLIDRKLRGSRCVNNAHRATHMAIIESGPIPALHGV